MSDDRDTTERVSPSMRWSIAALACLGAGCSILAAERGAVDSGPPRAGFLCYRAESAIRIDGDPSDPAWLNAQSIDNFAAPGDLDERRADGRTIARLLWDDDYLYFVAEMDDGAIVVSSQQDDERLWWGDVFELFFKPHGDGRGYYEFQVNPANARLDMYLPHRARDAYERWRAAQAFDWETAVQLTAAGWVVEGRIPWSDFAPTGGAAQRGDVWRFALARYDYDGFEAPLLSSNSLLSEADFHRHEEWSDLLFMKAAVHPIFSPR